MKVDVDFFERFGSRLDSDQPRCVRGAKWLRSQGWSFPVDYWIVYNECVRQRDAGEINRKDARQWLKWAKKLQKNAAAIDYFGTAERVNFVLVTPNGRKSYKTRAAARKARAKYRDKLKSDPLRVISAVKLENAPRGGKKTRPVSKFTDGTCYIHNPKTGQNELVSGTAAEIKAQAMDFARDRVTRRLARVRLYERVRDPVDGFEGLREIEQGAE